MDRLSQLLLSPALAERVAVLARRAETDPLLRDHALWLGLSVIEVSAAATAATEFTVSEERMKSATSIVASPDAGVCATIEAIETVPSGDDVEEPAACAVFGPKPVAVEPHAPAPSPAEGDPAIREGRLDAEPETVVEDEAAGSLTVVAPEVTDTAVAADEAIGSVEADLPIDFRSRVSADPAPTEPPEDAALLGRARTALADLRDALGPILALGASGDLGFHGPPKIQAAPVPRSGRRPRRPNAA